MAVAGDTARSRVIEGFKRSLALVGRRREAHEAVKIPHQELGNGTNFSENVTVLL